MNSKVFLVSVVLGLFSLAAMPVDAGEPGEYKLEGKGYLYYLHDASEGDGQSNSFDVARMYFGLKYYLSEAFTVRYLTDIGHQTSYSYNSENNKLSNASNGKFEVFTKYAYLDWKLRDNLKLKMGLQGTYNWKQPESAWEYRSISYSPMEAFGKYWGDWAKSYSSHLDTWAQADPTKVGAASNFDIARRSKMGSSADLGVAIEFKPSSVSYVNFMIRNGLGYKAVEDDMYKNFQLRGGMYLIDKSVHISGYVELEPWKGVDSDGGSTGYMNMQWDAMAAYTLEDRFTVGIDANSKIFAGIDNITATCFSIFGNAYVLPKKLKALARFDIYDTGFNDAKFAAGTQKWESNATRTIVGLDYKAHKKVSIIPNIQLVTPEDSDLDPDISVYIHLYFAL